MKRQEWYFFKNDKNSYDFVQFNPSPESDETKLNEKKANFKIIRNEDKNKTKNKYLAAYVYFFAKIERPNKILQSVSTNHLEKYKSGVNRIGKRTR